MTWKSGVLGSDSGGSRRGVSGALDMVAVAGVVTVVAATEPRMVYIDLTGAVAGSEVVKVLDEMESPSVTVTEEEKKESTTEARKEAWDDAGNAKN